MFDSCRQCVARGCDGRFNGCAGAAAAVKKKEKRKVGQKISCSTLQCTVFTSNIKNNNVILAKS